jgi:hypothetical protein
MVKEKKKRDVDTTKAKGKLKHSLDDNKKDNDSNLQISFIIRQPHMYNFHPKYNEEGNILKQWL